MGIQGGLRSGQFRAGGGYGGLVGARIDLVEGLAGFHLLAFLEQTFLDDATDLRPHFSNLVGGGAPGQLPAQSGGLGLYRNKANLWGLLLLLLAGLVSVTATGKLQGKSARQKGENQTAAHNHLCSQYTPSGTGSTNGRCLQEI